MRQTERNPRAKPKQRKDASKDGATDAPKGASHDTTTFAVEAGGWRAVGVSVASPGHLAAGKGCEDAICTLERNGILACALADGASTRGKSKIGARAAVAEACEELVEHFDALRASPLSDAMIFRINLRLSRLAAEYGAKREDFASTLAFVAVRGAEFVAGNLGDGVVAHVRNSGTTTLVEPEWGEFANLTYFATDHVAVRHTRMVQGEFDGDPGTVVLMSDGGTKRLYDYKSKVLAPNGVKIGSWLFQAGMNEVVDSLRAYMTDTLAPRSEDDCSIILVSRTGPQDAGRPTRRAAPRSVRSARRLAKAKPKKKPAKKKRAYSRRRAIERMAAQTRLRRHQSGGMNAARQKPAGGAFERIRLALTAMLRW